MSIFAKDDWEYETGPQDADRWRNVETDEIRYNKPADAEEGPEDAEDSAAEDVMSEEEMVNDIEDVGEGLRAPPDAVEMFEGIGGQMLRIGGNDGVRIEGLDEGRLDGDDFEDFDVESTTAEFLDDATNPSIRIEDDEGNRAFIDPKQSEASELEEYFDVEDTDESLRNPTEGELEEGQTLETDDGDEITVRTIGEGTGSIVADNNKIYDLDELYVPEEEQEETEETEEVDVDEEPDYIDQSPTKDQVYVGQELLSEYDGEIVVDEVRETSIKDQDGERHLFNELRIPDYRKDLNEDNVEVGEELVTGNGVRVTVDQVEDNGIFTERGVSIKYPDLQDPAEPDIRDEDFFIDVDVDDADISLQADDTVYDTDSDEVLQIETFDEGNNTFTVRGQSGGFFLGSSIELTEETRQQKVNEILDDMDEYDYNEDDFSSVAAEKVVRGNVVDEIRSYEWTRNYTDIEDDDLALDALKQVVTDGGSKTAEDKLRSRLRGMGYDTNEINRELGVGPSGDAAEDAEDVFEEHVPYGTKDRHSLLSERDREFAEDVYRNASTESLEEYIEQKTFPDTTEDKVNMFDELLNILENDPYSLNMNLQEEIEQTQTFYEDYESYDKEGQVEEFFENNESQIKDHLDLEPYGDTVTNMAKMTLYLREDSDMIDEPTDVIDMVNEDDLTAPDREKVEDGFGKFFNKVDDEFLVGIMSNFNEFEIDSLSSDGRYRKGDQKAILDPSTMGYRQENTAIHEMGHHLHHQIGFEAENYPSYDPTKPKEQYDFGTPEGSPYSDNVGFRDALKKISKNWDNYQNDEVDELRSYQKRGGIEYAAVSFRHWTKDEFKLKRKDPYQYLFWERWAGGADEIVENDDNSLERDDLEIGDEAVVDMGSGPEYAEVKEKTPIEGGDDMFIKYEREDGGTFMLRGDRATDEVEQVVK